MNGDTGVCAVCGKPINRVFPLDMWIHDGWPLFATDMLRLYGERPDWHEARPA